MKIALSADTSCTISKECAKKLGIKVFSLNVFINGEEFLDGVSITLDELAKSMRSGCNIKTSTPPPQDVIDYFTKIFDEGYDRIIHFTISSKLSSMYQLFSMISRDEFDNKVIVIDSYSVCSLMLSHVMYAYDEIKKDTEIEKIVEGIEKRKEKNSVIFVPENLTALKNGGRISPAVAALGNMIGLKPVIQLKEGALEKDSMTRNTKKAFQEHINKLADSYPINEFDYCIVSFDGNESLVSYIIKVLSEKFDNYDPIVTPFAINVGAHTGPGSIGLLVTPKINGKSLSEFIK